MVGTTLVEQARNAAKVARGQEFWMGMGVEFVRGVWGGAPGSGQSPESRGSALGGVAKPGTADRLASKAGPGDRGHLGETSLGGGQAAIGQAGQADRSGGGTDYGGEFYWPWPFIPEDDDPEDPTDGPWPSLACDTAIVTWVSSIDCALAADDAGDVYESILELNNPGTEYNCTCSFLQSFVVQANAGVCEFDVTCIYFCLCESSAFATQAGEPIA